MKTRKALIVILILAVLVVYYLIGSDYMRQRNQKDVLAGQIVDTNAALALVPLPPADLDVQLADAQDSLWEAQEAFNVDTNITRIVNRILRLGEETGVKVIPLSTQSWIIEKVLEQNYLVFRITIAISGSYPQVVDFLSRLESGEPETLIIEYVNAEKISGSFLIESPDEGPVNADVRIAVYATPATD